MQFGTSTGRPLADAVNAAVEAARGTVLTFLLPNARTKFEGVKRLATELAGHEVGAAGPLLVHGQGAQRYKPFVGTTLADEHAYRDKLAIENIDYVSSTTCLGINGLTTRRETFLDTGGFRPSIQMADAAAADYCLRLIQSGFMTAVCHEVLWDGVAPTHGRETALEDRSLAKSWRLSPPVTAVDTLVAAAMTVSH